MSSRLPKYYNQSDEGTFLFDIELCETCNQPLRVGGFKSYSSPSVLHNYGVNPYPYLPAEGYYSDTLEAEVCENCDPDLQKEEEDTQTSMTLTSIDLRLKALGLPASKRRFIHFIIKYLLNE